jgi:hypothetical protein
MKKIYRYSVFTLFVFLVSCANEENTISKITYLPKVKDSWKTGLSQISKIKNQQTSQIGRISETLDFDQAITAKYEGNDDMEFVFIPNNSMLNEFLLYSFKNGELTDLYLTIKNYQNSIIISNEAGEVIVDLENNFVKNISVTSYINSNNSTGRLSCDPAGDFLAYENEVQQQLVNSVGSWGALAFDIGCSLWVVCRGAVVAAGVIYAASNCVS